MASKFKEYIKSQNQRGRLLIVYRVGIRIQKQIITVADYLGKFLNKILIFYYIRIKQYKMLETDLSLPNGCFLVFIRHRGDEKQVIKIPRRDTVFGRSFLKKLIHSKEKENYCNTLENLKKTQTVLNNHIGGVEEVYRNGSYSMEYISGCNLKTLFNNLLIGKKSVPHAILLDIISAIDVFINNLRVYIDNNTLIGDWGLHNILYDKDSKRIVNVDLEGFYLYRKGTEVENDVQLLKMQLFQLQDIIRIYTSIDADSTNIKKALAILNYTKASNSEYNAEHYASAYHSIKLGNYYFRGQRECKKRLSSIDIDFNNKVVLDIGCNTGGMLRTLADEIFIGVGIDYDARCINAANLIKQINNESNLSFYVFDLENEDLDLIKNYILADKVDICLLLSVCMWIKNWKEVIEFAAKISNILVFESNGSLEQQNNQVAMLKKIYKTVELIKSVSDDDIRINNRRLYVCSN